jgi:hypothetical protein
MKVACISGKINGRTVASSVSCRQTWTPGALNVSLTPKAPVTVKVYGSSQSTVGWGVRMRYESKRTFIRASSMDRGTLTPMK